MHPLQALDTGARDVYNAKRQQKAPAWEQCLLEAEFPAIPFASGFHPVHPLCQKSRRREKNAGGSFCVGLWIVTGQPTEQVKLALRSSIVARFVPVKFFDQAGYPSKNLTE